MTNHVEMPNDFSDHFSIEDMMANVLVNQFVLARLIAKNPDSQEMIDDINDIIYTTMNHGIGVDGHYVLRRENYPILFDRFEAAATRLQNLISDISDSS